MRATGIFLATRNFSEAFRVQRAYVKVGVSGNRTTTLVASYGDYKRVNGVNTVLGGSIVLIYLTGNDVTGVGIADDPLIPGAVFSINEGIIIFTKIFS